MSDTFTLKTGDSLPLFTADLDTDLSAVDEVRFYVEFPREDELIVNDLMTVVDVTGEVEYQFTESETAYNGSHYGEIRVTYSNGDIESFPKRGYYELDFTETVDRNVSVTSSEEDLTLTHLDAEKINTESVVVHTESKHNDDVPALYGTDGDISFTFDPTAGAQVLRDEAGSQDLLVAQLSGDISASGTQLYDATNGVVPQSTLGGPASSLSVYPLDGVDIADAAISRSHLSPSFYTQSEADSAFVDAAGDSMSGDLTITSGDAILSGTYGKLRFQTDNARIDTYGTTGGRIRVWDRQNAQIIANFKNGGDVEIPNGWLTVDGQLHTKDNSGLQVSGGGNYITLDMYDGLRRHGSGTMLISTTGDGSDAVSLYDSANSLHMLIAREGGNVEIPNGDLNIGGNLHLDNHNWITGIAGDGSERRMLRYSPADDVVLSVDSRSGADIVLDARDNDNELRLTSDSKLIYTGWGGTDLFRVDSQGDAEFRHGSITQGYNPAETISETTSPKSFNFDGSYDRDIHDFVEVTISNSSSSSATEDITVELYDGSDTTGTLIASETKTVSVASGGTNWPDFITSDLSLDTGTYHIEVTQSGTTLSIDQSDENTKGATYEFGQTAVGDLSLTNQDGTEALRVDAISENVEIPNGNLSVEQIIDSTLASPTIDFNGDVLYHRIEEAGGQIQLRDHYNGYGVLSAFEGGNVEIPNGTLYVAGEGSIAGTTAGVGIASHLKFTGDQRIHPQIRTPGGGGQSIYVTDDANGQTIAQFLEGGNVDIPSGDVMLGANINFTGDTDTTPAILSPGIDGTHNIRIWDQYNAQAIIDFQEGGNVEIPNGPILQGGTAADVPGANSFADPIVLETDGTTTPRLQFRAGTLDTKVYGDDNGTLHFESESGADSLLLHSGQDVEIPNGGLTITDAASHISYNVESGATGTGRVIQEYQHAGTAKWDTVLKEDTDNRLRFRDRVNSTYVMDLNPGGNVAIPNGHTEIADGVEHQQRASDPSTSELAAGQNMTYASDGSTGVTGAAGDLVYAVNDAGTILTTVVAAKSNAT